jgi:hypothetical protein
MAVTIQHQPEKENEQLFVSLKLKMKIWPLEINWYFISELYLMPFYIFVPCVYSVPIIEYKPIKLL